MKITHMAFLGLLTACSPSNTKQANAKICQPLRAAGEPMVNCVHKYAYRLAKAPGSANEITDSVLEACTIEITDWIAKGKTAADRADREQIWEAMRADAKFRVLEARAGNCDAH